MSVSATFEVLADPTRRQIVAFLADGEAPAGEIAAQFNSTPPAVSQHLRVLRDAGVVAVRPDAQRRFYRLNRAAMVEAAEWLVRMAGQP